MKPQNIIKQDFSAQEPLRKLLTDITQIPCKDGKLYVSPLLDCYNGEIISLVMDTNMKKELCIKTITEAYKNFDIKSGAIILKRLRKPVYKLRVQKDARTAACCPEYEWSWQMFL